MKTYLVKGRDALDLWVEVKIRAESRLEASNIFYQKHGGEALVIYELAE